MDPYKVLGVNPSDDEETIKKAYRTLVKKYHPDRYVNTPMADMATEKLKEINEAYDMITNKKTDSYTSSGTSARAEYRSSYSVSFDSVRMLIRLRRFAEAEAILSQLPQNAEWNYLLGVIYINRGWYAKGREYVRKAAAMDPQNAEYAATLGSFDSQNRSYREYHTEYTDCCGPCSLTNCLCTGLLCSNCCCC